MTISAAPLPIQSTSLSFFFFTMKPVNDRHKYFRIVKTSDQSLSAHETTFTEYLFLVLRLTAANISFLTLMMAYSQKRLKNLKKKV